MDLEEKYREETGFSVGKIHDIGTTYYSNDYVEWLEKQLLLPRVMFELPDDSIFKQDPVDLKTPLEKFYYYQRPSYSKQDQDEFRETLLEALDYLKGN